VIDHSSFFARSSGITFHLQQDENNQEQLFGMKSLWTCVIECVLEYCRILFDIFEDETLVCSFLMTRREREIHSYLNRSH
jgi:hypothetical protein